MTIRASPRDIGLRAHALGQFKYALLPSGIRSIILCLILIGHWLDMVYLPPRGNFVDHIFLKA